jgi:hypothetical protein
MIKKTIDPPLPNFAPKAPASHASPKTQQGREPRTQRACFRCSQGQLIRVARHGFWEEKVLTWLGIYPWECLSCRRRTWRRGRGAGDQP